MAASPNKLSPLRILIAEDNEVNRRLALLLLNRLGYTADVVVNGREAVEAVRDRPYDVVLMDCHMPELDGYAATGEIRTLTTGAADRPCPRIIAVTAAAMSGDREKCLAAGMDDYVTKPVKADALRAALELATVPGPAPAPASSAPQFEGESETELRQTTDSLAAELGGDSVKELVEAYLTDTPERLKEMEQLAGGEDQVTLRRLAHSLKGTSTLFGLSRSGAVAATLEKVAAAEQKADQVALVRELAALFSSSLPLLERRIRELVPG
jgi:CheY-like chemotaxis protein